MEMLWSFTYHIVAIGGIGYCAYNLGHFAGYTKCEKFYEDYLDKRSKRVYNSNNDSNTK